MQSNPHSRMNGRPPNGVGLALVAMPRLSVAKRPVGDRRPYTPLHRYGYEPQLKPRITRMRTDEEEIAEMRVVACRVNCSAAGMSAGNPKPSRSLSVLIRVIRGHQMPNPV
ncbi:MAG: hypothetical protein HY736_08825 [Verrucomicrobia bacterium]|nr:hypothetical protein [Verrucomicrobiota bacterium]